MKKENNHFLVRVSKYGSGYHGEVIAFLGGGFMNTMQIKNFKTKESAKKWFDKMVKEYLS